MNGTTNQAFSNQQIDVEALNWDKKIIELGSGRTDSTGFFSMTYTEPDISNHPSIQITGGNFQLSNIPLNKNIDSTFYLSTMGSIKIYLKPTIPLSNTDTVFFGRTIINAQGDVAGVEVDTILHTVDGYFKTFRTYPPLITIFIARGWKNFGYSFQDGKFHSTSVKSLGIHLTGDPYIDSTTITY